MQILRGDIWRFPPAPMGELVSLGLSFLFHIMGAALFFPIHRMVVRVLSIPFTVSCDLEIQRVSIVLRKPQLTVLFYFFLEEIKNWQKWWISLCFPTFPFVKMTVTSPT